MKTFIAALFVVFTTFSAIADERMKTIYQPYNGVDGYVDLSTYSVADPFVDQIGFAVAVDGSQVGTAHQLVLSASGHSSMNDNLLEGAARYRLGDTDFFVDTGISSVFLKVGASDGVKYESAGARFELPRMYTEVGTVEAYVDFGLQHVEENGFGAMMQAGFSVANGNHAVVFAPERSMIQTVSDIKYQYTLLTDHSHIVFSAGYKGYAMSEIDQTQHIASDTKYANVKFVF